MKHLARIVMVNGKGDRYGLVHTDTDSGKSLLAFCWVDRDRRYFISSCSSLVAGPKTNRRRWRQIDKTPDADPDPVNIFVPTPKACSLYYSACQGIDQHNRKRQDDLKLERKVHTVSWNKRVNMSLFGMMVVDSYLLAQGCNGHTFWASPNQFFRRLAQELIDNTFEMRDLRRRAQRDDVAGLVSPIGNKKKRPAAVAVESLRQQTAPTPTKRMKKNNKKHHSQGRCLIKGCPGWSSHVCRECQRRFPKAKDHQFWICNLPGKICMGIHIQNKHPGMIAEVSSAGI